MPALALALVATAIASAASIDQASAQPAPAWPSKPIRLIVPFAAGGNVDLTARLVAPAMADTLGQPIVVENRTGAGGMVGAEVVAKAAPDGYVLLTGSNSTFSVVPALYPNAPYNPVRDFTPIIKGTTPA
jgi:tripartite-type tricarboxylate transporter receptor subunit TctC